MKVTKFFDAIQPYHFLRGNVQPIKAIIQGSEGIAIDHHLMSILKFKDGIQVMALGDIIFTF